MIEDNNYQKFFPTERVVAIGEVKSDLSKSQLKEALIKLKNNKLLRESIPTNNSFIFSDENKLMYDPKNNHKDQIITFLICNKFDFDFTNLVNEMDDIYDNCECYLRHNMVISIMDGTLMYKGEDNKYNLYPFLRNCKLRNTIIRPFLPEYKKEYIYGLRNYKYEHIVGFLNFMYMGTSMTSILYPEITNYLGTMRLNRSIDEKVETNG